MANIFKPTEAFDIRRKEVSEAMNLNGMEAHKYNNFLAEIREQVTEGLFVNSVYLELSSAKNRQVGRQKKRNGSRTGWHEW